MPKKEKTKMTKAKINPYDMESFVRLWQAANRLKDVVDATGKHERWCSNTASYLRRKGVGLKKFSRSLGRTAADYEKLAALAVSLNGHH